ncbi:MAG: FkbM family methyltransferase [Rhodoluna sp.]
MSGRLGPLGRFSETLKSTIGPDNHQRFRKRLLPIYSRIPRIHWSQSGEDIILNELLPEEHGTYVDVGAAHPRLGSNTYFLYRRGWYGTLIEPNPASALTLRKARPRDRVVEAAASAKSGVTKFTIFQSDYLSSIDPCVTQERADAGEIVESILEIPLITLADLGLHASPDQPSLLSVDCEGADLEVLRGNDWTAFTPRVICVEEPAETLTNPTEIRQLVQDQGYRLCAHTGLSAIYTHARSRATPRSILPKPREEIFSPEHSGNTQS